MSVIPKILSVFAKWLVDMLVLIWHNCILHVQKCAMYRRFRPGSMSSRSPCSLEMLLKEILEQFILRMLEMLWLNITVLSISVDTGYRCVVFSFVLKQNNSDFCTSKAPTSSRGSGVLGVPKRLIQDSLDCQPTWKPCYFFNNTCSSSQGRLHTLKSVLVKAKHPPVLVSWARSWYLWYSKRYPFPLFVRKYIFFQF